MEIVKTKTVIKEVEETIDSYTQCDRCGNRVRKTTYDAFECQLSYRTGDSYPEGGYGESWQLDLCQECAPKLVSLLNKNGFNVQHSEWDW